MSFKRYPITPVAAPRLNRKSHWNPQKRAQAERYHAFRDECRLRRVQIPERPWIVFEMPVPGCGADRIGHPHQQKPDFDNLGKALTDAVLREDSHLWDVRVTKLWAASGAILIGSIGDEYPQ